MNVILSQTDWALKYDGHGWRVLPLWRPDGNGVCTCPKGERCQSPGKHPRTHHGATGATTDPKTITRWKWETANIGIATGPVSGLVVLDIDPRNGGKESMGELQKRLGKLPIDLLVNTAGGGWHDYFQHPDVTIPNRDLAPGVEVKAAGRFVVAPPSLHASGNCYGWHNGSDTSPPELPARWLDFILSQEEVAQKAPTAQKAQESTVISVSTVSAGNLSGCLSAAISASLPEGPGQRHKRQWELARRLQAFPFKVDPVTVFTSWWQEAGPKTSGEHSYEESLSEFLTQYESVRYPWGTTPVTALLERAKQADPPAAVADFPTPEFGTLAALCRELQQEVGDKPFFLSSHQAAEMLGKHPKQVWQWLRLLCRIGVLELVSVGNRHQANEYRYLGDL